MDKNTIGTAAGTIWRLLSTNYSLSYERLKSSTNLDERLLNAAIGWLARENKIEIEYDTRCQAENIQLLMPPMYY